MIEAVRSGRSDNPAVMATLHFIQHHDCLLSKVVISPSYNEHTCIPDDIPFLVYHSWIATRITFYHDIQKYWVPFFQRLIRMVFS